MLLWTACLASPGVTSWTRLWVPAHRQGQKLCIATLTAVLGDVTFAVHSMDFYKAEQFVKP